jgi:TrmH family RNA methyltransferase
MEMITSRSNSRIKFVRGLYERKQRSAGGFLLAEGIHAVGQAVEAGASIAAIFYAPDLLTSDYARRLVEEQQAGGGEVYPVSADVFALIAEKDNPQGILAVVRQKAVSLEGLSPFNFTWGVALVTPQDAGNVGTILRTIDAVGADGLLLLDGGVDGLHPGLVRASMGAIFWHPVVNASFAGFAAWAGKYGYHIYGTSAHASMVVGDLARYEKPAVLLLGSERNGLTPEQAGICTQVLCLPMQGHVSSLNLSVAAGVLLYDMLGRGCGLSD